MRAPIVLINAWRRDLVDVDGLEATLDIGMGANQTFHDQLVETLLDLPMDGPGARREHTLSLDGQLEWHVAHVATDGLMNCWITNIDRQAEFHQQWPPAVFADADMVMGELLWSSSLPP